MSDDLVPTADGAQAIGTLEKRWSQLRAIDVAGDLHIIPAIAGGTIRAHRGIGGASLVEIDAFSAVSLGKLVGIAYMAALVDDPLDIIIRGKIVDPAFSWTPDQAVYLGQNGGLTQVIPSVVGGFAYSQRVGVAIGATTLWVAIDPPILLV